MLPNSVRFFHRHPATRVSRQRRRRDRRGGGCRRFVIAISRAERSRRHRPPTKYRETAIGLFRMTAARQRRCRGVHHARRLHVGPAPAGSTTLLPTDRWPTPPLAPSAMCACCVSTVRGPRRRLCASVLLCYRFDE